MTVSKAYVLQKTQNRSWPALPCLPNCYYVCLRLTLLQRSHFSSSVTNRSRSESFLNSLRKETATEIWLIVSKHGIHISSFKSNSILFKRRKTVDRLMLSAVPTSSDRRLLCTILSNMSSLSEGRPWIIFEG